MKRQSIFKTLALTLVGFRCLVQTGEIQGQAISVPAGISYTTFPSGFDYKVAFGDFNGDGKTDLAARNCQTGDVLIYYSNGTSFSSSPDQMVQIAVPDCANWDLHAADINGDGYADLINRSRVGGELYVHYNTGNGFNTVGGGFGVTPTPSNWKSMFADINGDRRADLVNLNLDTGDTYIHFNNQQGFGMVADRLIPGLGVPATYNPDWSQTLADLNGDGLAEFVNVQKAQGYFYGHNNQGSTFETTSTLILQGPSPTSFADLYLADLTGDGLADVVLLRGNTQIYVYTTSKNAKGELVAVVGSSPPTDSPCQTPTVGAGMGQAITLPAQASLAGSSSAATVTWSKVDGPGSVSFSNASSLYTTASFSVAGNYILKLTARDGACESEATVSVTVNSAPTKANAAPYVNAGPDQTILFPKSAALSGVATDDGLPKNVLIYKWSKVSGPGRVTFQNTSALQTAVSFSAAGTYTLRLTGSDTQLTSYDDILIRAQANAAPSVNAGPDQTGVDVFLGTTLNGIASDDGLPTGSLAVQWTKISGRGTVTFGSPSAKSSTAVFSSVGTYVLRLTASDGALSRADDLQITVYEPALAGAVITGTVHDKRNQAAIGALVEGRVNGKVVCYGSTDATGSYRFPSISAGTYSMHAELAGQKGDNSNCAVFYPDVSYVNKPPAVCNININ